MVSPKAAMVSPSQGHGGEYPAAVASGVMSMVSPRATVVSSRPPWRAV